MKKNPRRIDRKTGLADRSSTPAVTRGKRVEGFRRPKEGAPFVARSEAAPSKRIDWSRVAELALTSRVLDLLEEEELYPTKDIAYQFSAKGHELIQVLLGLQLTHPRDAVTVYYRSRPMMLTLGLTVDEALAASLGRAGGMSDGRDIGVVFNMPATGHAQVLPMAGDVGGQYTIAAGWAEGIRYHREVLDDRSYDGAIAVVMGGEGSVATNGFWSALTAATATRLPLLFLIEDNGYAISVPSDRQIPDGDVSKNLAAFGNLEIYRGDGTVPAEAARLTRRAVEHVRRQGSPALLHLTVPRLAGHSGQDSQRYKRLSVIREEKKRDPLLHLMRYLVPARLSRGDWNRVRESARRTVREGFELAKCRPQPAPSGILAFRYSDVLSTRGAPAIPGCRQPEPTESARINMQEGIRRTLRSELRANPKMILFGEDVGPKGGVHAVTAGLQDELGERRVYDTSLSEEGIIGRAVGMALCGLRPAPEIQFRKYADPATEQLHNCGTMRWRTAGRFSAPIVVRMAGGFSRRAGDPWHSVSSEVSFAHAVGWCVAYPSNAEDAVGLLRFALRAADPTIFFEHRALLDAPSARTSYPGDDYVVPFGLAREVRAGNDITIVTWGAMVERCMAAIEGMPRRPESIPSVHLLDLRTVSPWDAEAVLRSVCRTHRALVVHEDGATGGFGAEIVATIASEAFRYLDAPVLRIAVPDVPIPYNPLLMEAVLPSVESIQAAIVETLEF